MMTSPIWPDVTISVSFSTANEYSRFCTVSMVRSASVAAWSIRLTSSID